MRLLTGVDNLTTEEAYAKVFQKSSSYITGLGAGPRYPQNRKYNKEFNDEWHSQLTQQIKEQLAQVLAALRASQMTN